jgi:hypothetical protein
MTGIEIECYRNYILVWVIQKKGNFLEKKSIDIRIILKCTLRLGVQGCELRAQL